MRDVIVTFIVFYGCLVTLKTPYKGVLLYSWLSYMNPHRLSYGFAYDMPFAFIAALVLILSMLFSNQVKRPPLNNLTILWVIFILFMGITSFTAYYQEIALEYFNRVWKIQLIAFLTMALMTDFNKLKQLIWVIVLSIGFFTVKGGVYTILTAGSGRVWGPPDSMIEGNNELAVATLMIIPLMAFLYKFSTHKIVKTGLLAAMPLSFIAAIGTQSRGALIAFGAVALFFWLKSENKAIMAIVFIIFSASIFAMMPDSWHTRMNTIETYEEDASAMGRINAWYYAVNAANHRFFGMGFSSWSRETFALYAPDPNDAHAAHSIYFSVLGDHGWLGLIMFLMIFKMTWSLLIKTIKTTNNSEPLLEINFLSKMLQVSFIAYFVGGAFLSLSYFDLPWHFIAIVLCINRIISESARPDKQPIVKQVS